MPYSKKMNGPCGHRRRRKALTFEHPPPLKFFNCRGGFVKFHPPPEALKGSNISYPFTLRRRKKSTTAYHPLPKKVNEYTRTYRAAQRIALECQRGSPKVKDALHNSL
tara:strand:+ start:276 stop:599 length:324 start_codon:yes stop_codon:yes gene_type:complete